MIIDPLSFTLGVLTACGVAFLVFHSLANTKDIPCRTDDGDPDA